MAVGLIRVAYQEGGEAVEAAKESVTQLLGVARPQGLEHVCYPSAEDAAAAVSKEEADFALAPVDSSTRGSFHRTYELVLRHRLFVSGECDAPSPSPESKADRTRFWLLAKAPMSDAQLKTASCKTSLVFAFASGNEHGQLYRALGVFASRRLDLAKIESRPWSSEEPLAGKAKFLFYADLQARQSDAEVVDALAELTKMCAYVRVLGCYPTSNSGSAVLDGGALAQSDPSMAEKYPLNAVFEKTKVAKTIMIHGATKQMEAEGKPVYSLCVGEPDFPPPPRVMAAGIKAIEDGNTRYCDMRGIAELRELIATYLRRTKGVSYDPATEVQVCSGAQQALYNVILAICRPGDKIVLPSPYWGNYEGIVTQVKAGLVTLRTKLEEDYLINPEALEKTLIENPETKILILCNPSNPAGTLHSPEHLERIAAVLRKPQFRHVVVISDEIYEQLVFQDEGVPERKHVSFATIPDMFERTVHINGFSKAFSMTGMRVGYVTGPKHFIMPCQLMQGQTTSCANTVGQIMAIEALKMEMECVDKGELRIAKDLHDLDTKRKYVVKRLRAIPNLRFPTPTSSFYLFMDLALFFDGKKAYSKDRTQVLHNVDDFCEYLIHKSGVAAAPGSDYGENFGLRLSFASSMDTLTHAMDGIELAFKSLTFE